MLMGVDDVHRDPIPVGQIMIHTSEKEWEEPFYSHLLTPCVTMNQC